MALTLESDTMYRLIAPLLIAFAVAGCNTVEGMGKVISKGGDAVQVPRRV